MKFSYKSDNNFEAITKNLYFFEDKWELVLSGYWSDDRFHSGYIEYCIQQTDENTWIMSTKFRSILRK